MNISPLDFSLNYPRYKKQNKKRCCTKSLPVFKMFFTQGDCVPSLYFVFLVFAVNENQYEGSWKDDKKLFAVIVFCLLVVHSPVYFVLLFAVSENWYGGSRKDDKKLFPVIVFCLLGVRSQ